MRAQTAVAAHLGLVVPTLSRFSYAMSRHDLHVKTQTQSRPRISSRDIGTSSHDQALSRHEIPCRDLVSKTYTSLCRDKEKSYLNIKFLVASALCRDRIPLLRAHLYRARPGLSCALGLTIVCAWFGLSRTLDLFCHDITRRHIVVRAILRTSSLVVCDRALCRGQL